MSINLYIALAASFITHWLADFVMQTDWMATNKSKSMAALLSHTVTYTTCWIPFAFYFLPEHLKTSSELLRNVILPPSFLVITFICHTATDYITSRITSKLYQQQKIHKFFVVVGFDQVLHYIQLFATFFILRTI